MAMTCYTDWKFVGAGKYGKARGLLRYLQYREDRINHAPRAGGAERWIDCGLGRGWREILDNASELQTNKVGCDRWSSARRKRCSRSSNRPIPSGGPTGWI
ncbi:MAG: hypothetical protein ACUVWZ_12565 [Anaerolineae bacterium]